MTSQSAHTQRTRDRHTHTVNFFPLIGKHLQWLEMVHLQLSSDISFKPKAIVLACLNTMSVFVSFSGCESSMFIPLSSSQSLQIKTSGATLKIKHPTVPLGV